MKPIDIPKDAPLEIMARLPPKSFSVYEGKVTLEWPEEAAQQYVCLNCGPINQIELKTRATFSTCIKETFVFESGRYVHLNSESERPDEDSLEYEAVICTKCGQIVMKDGANMTVPPEVK